MKFGKEFVLQMLPEWKEAYIDYNDLKTLLKDILKFKQKDQETTPKALKRDMTLYRAFSGLNQRYSDFKNPKGDIEDQFIVVNAVNGEDSNVNYETKFLMPSEELSEYEITFFRTLDYEFNKVHKFYKDKVKEVMNEAVSLNKQMDALIALRIKVENPNFDGSGAVRDLAADVASLATSTVSTPSSPRMSKWEHMVVIPEMELSNEEELEESNESVDVGNSNVSEKNPYTYRPAPLEILEYVKINNTLETPTSTIKAVLKDSKSEKLKFNKKELKKVEEQLKQVFIEFHSKLLLLKRYSYMNLLALSKVMKKYDKVRHPLVDPNVFFPPLSYITYSKLRQGFPLLPQGVASRSYLKAVDNSYLGSSDEVTTLLERVEATFIKHFSNSNRRKGMKSLRPKAKKGKHKTTFFLGYFSGCTTALIVALILIINARKLMNKEGSIQYMENIFPLYRQARTSLKLLFFLPANSLKLPIHLFAYIILHMLMYAVDIFFWKRYRVNYPFIFGFKQGTELGYREVFLLSAGLALLSLAGVLANLDIEMDPRTQSCQTFTELIPLGLVTLVIAITFCPFNIIYRSSRLFLIKSLFRCICAPFYKVTLIDFFLADQLTSQVQAIRSLEFYICYYGWGDFTKRENSCRSSTIYNSFYFIVAVLPYWSRLLQCIRRLFEEKDVTQAYNGLKYLLTIIAVVTRTAYDLKKGMSWRVLAAVSSAIAAIMSTYWDIVKDWGLLQRHSKNPWLRDKLVISHTSVYFAAMVLNIILRLAWLQSVLNFHVSFLHQTALTTIVACLEILRRGMWSFFRLENEHLNNVGKFRAFKSVPLPFNYYNEDDDKDE
ncbi:SPX [Macleaya cordata]|uniref:SPX n=1 Tax=Macleaya cordata TaxID=56857 RepID=A0A200QP66_MACCD|nr:SPX [Macleaya cordata]